MVGMLVVGIGFVLAGLLAIGFGIPVQEFSFGNTLILAGVPAVCCGAIMLSIWAAVRELKSAAGRLGSGVLAEPRRDVQPLVPGPVPRAPSPAEGGFPPDQPPAEPSVRAEPAPPPSSPPPWHEEAAARERPRSSEVPSEAEPAEAASTARPKRNLLFSSTSRKERERAQARTSEPLPPDLLSPELRPDPSAAPPAEPSEPPASFDDAWPKSERSRPGEAASPQRSPRVSSPSASTPPSTFSRTTVAGGRPEEQPAVTVLKSGVVDGMAYSLYSDGSIEAQMPEGMMRFASIDELRAHLDHRP